MPRTALTVVTGPSQWSILGKVVAMASADVANGNSIVCPAGSNIALWVHNTNAGAQTLTVNSAPLPTYGREADITSLSIAAGQYRFFRFADVGWAIGGVIEVNGSHADLKFGVVDLNGVEST